MPERLTRRRARHGRPPVAVEATDAALARLARLHVTDADAPIGEGPPPALPPGERSRLDGLRDRLPLALRGATWSATGRAVGALVAVLVLAVVATVVLVWWSRPRATGLPRVQRVGGVSSAPAVSASASATGSASVVVHVAGAVHRPGLVTLPAGSRVAAAVEAAGGATARAQLGSVNLARPLVDGEQVVVLRRGQGAVAVADPGASASSGGRTGPVDLNAATLEQLDGLPGIGPVLAQRILDWRIAHGRFGSVDELSEVSGIGEKTLADLRPQVRV